MSMQETSTFLSDLRTRRDEAKKNRTRWPITAVDLIKAYAAGERDLSGANLFRANLFRANLSGVNLSHADLSGANLSHADLSRANLSHADLSRANLSGANLSRANLSGVNLSGANLSRANLSGVNLSGVNLPKDYHILQIGPGGSRNSYTIAIVLPDGEHIVVTGCFSGSLAQFTQQVKETYPDATSEHRQHYNRVIVAIRSFFKQYPEPQEKE